MEIYNATREHLCNSLSQLQRLQEEGVSVGSLPEEMWQRIVDLIELEDNEKLAEVREELKNINEKEVIIGCW